MQKRMGTRLRTLVKNHKRTKQIQLSGRGRLTEKVRDSMQNYYGRAIRDNLDNIHAMKKLFGQSFFIVLLSLIVAIATGCV